MTRYSMEEIRTRTYKERDAWWTVLLVDPYTGRLVRWIANHTSVTPNQLTTVGLVLGAGAAIAFAGATPGWLLIGALLYHLSFVVDCMDGKIARLKGTGTVFGSWLDYIFDRVRVVACTVALMNGQYRLTGHDAYLYTAVLVITLDMLRYMDALQVYKLRRVMADRLADAGIAAPGDADREGFQMPAMPVVKPAAAKGFRDRLARARIRSHLVSGIEFQMAVFIIGPVTRAIIPTVIVAGALLLVFELYVIVRLYASTRGFERMLGPTGAPR